MLETARLNLRELTVDDADFIVAQLNDPDFIRNVADRGVRTAAAARDVPPGRAARELPAPRLRPLSRRVEKFAHADRHLRPHQARHARGRRPRLRVPAAVPRTGLRARSGNCVDGVCAHARIDARGGDRVAAQCGFDQAAGRLGFAYERPRPSRRRRRGARVVCVSAAGGSRDGIGSALVPDAVGLGTMAAPVQRACCPVHRTEARWKGGSFWNRARRFRRRGHLARCRRAGRARRRASTRARASSTGTGRRSRRRRSRPRRTTCSIIRMRARRASC